MTVLVIDIGSSSVRALLFDDQLHPLEGGSVSRPHQFTTVPAGAAMFDALALRQRTEACLDEVLRHPAAQEIRVVGMATLVGNVLGVDENNQPLTPIFTYADTRSADDVALLADQLDLVAAHQRAGCPHHSAYQAGRLHWLRRTEPDLFGRVACWLDVGTYLYRAWFGRAVPCSYSVASWSGLLGRADLQWDAEWLSVLDLDPVRLPTLADYATFQHGLQADYAERWRDLRDVPFCLAVGDGAAANVGSGAVDDEHIALTIGTTAALRMISAEELPPVPQGLWSYRLDRAHHLIGGATSEGGNIFEWSRRVLALEGDLEKALAERPADGHGLTFLPLLAGERSPGWSTDATGSVIGLRLSTTPLDILQAALEGVALRLSLVYEQLPAHKGRHVMASGGALGASPAWAQMIVNALDCPLNLLAEAEITGRGTALLALKAAGMAGLNDFPPHIGKVIAPQPDQIQRLAAARQRQVKLYRDLLGS